VILDGGLRTAGSAISPSKRSRDGHRGCTFCTAHKARLGFKNYTTQRKKKSLTSVQFTRGVLEQLTSAQIAVGVRVVANLRVAPATNDSIKDQVSRK
jgi:hypothetical protein